MGAPHHQRVYVQDSRTQNVTMGGDLVEYGMMFNQTQTFLDDAEGQAERCEGCKAKKKSSLSTDLSTLHHHWLTSVPLQLFHNVRQKRQISQFQSRMSHFQKMFDHKSAEMARW